MDHHGHRRQAQRNVSQQKECRQPHRFQLLMYLSFETRFCQHLPAPSSESRVSHSAHDRFYVRGMKRKYNHEPSNWSLGWRFRKQSDSGPYQRDPELEDLLLNLLQGTVKAERLVSSRPWWKNKEGRMMKDGVWFAFCGRTMTKVELRKQL